MKKKKVNVEIAAISSLIDTKDYLAVKDKQINSYFFQEFKEIAKFIDDYYLKNSAVPTERVIHLNFPAIKLEHKEDGKVGTEEPITYWLDELRKRKKHNYIAETTEAIAESLEDFETDKAYAVMKKAVLTVENEIVETQSLDITKDSVDRKKVYLERENNKGMIGIPTGIKGLDYAIKGL